VSDRSTEDFYDALADEYHLIFDDWWSSAHWQGQVLAQLLAAEGVAPPARVLDCTCGIGTQALPLAGLGYAVTGIDLSEASIDRAKREAALRNVSIAFSVADVREIPAELAGTFDAIISCDNALPHLLNDTDLEAAFSSIRRSLNSEGVFLATIRDYDELRSERSTGIAPRLFGPSGSRYGYAQAWAWSSDGSVVNVSLFILREIPDGWRTSVYDTTYRALLRPEVDSILMRSTFADPRWLMPRASGYYQPIVIAYGNP
jgi:glycine/sarcosine N-methyltransferase